MSGLIWFVKLVVINIIFWNSNLFFSIYYTHKYVQTILAYWTNTCIYTTDCYYIIKCDQHNSILTYSRFKWLIGKNWVLKAERYLHWNNWLKLLTFTDMNKDWELNGTIPHPNYQVADSNILERVPGQYHWPHLSHLRISLQKK